MLRCPAKGGDLCCLQRFPPRPVSGGRSGARFSGAAAFHGPAAAPLPGFGIARFFPCREGYRRYICAGRRCPRSPAFCAGEWFRSSFVSPCLKRLFPRVPGGPLSRRREDRARENAEVPSAKAGGGHLSIGGGKQKRPLSPASPRRADARISGSGRPFPAAVSL